MKKLFIKTKVPKVDQLIIIKAAAMSTVNRKKI
jgi:hypothetical protein